jgi:hypothetical protein
MHHYGVTDHHQSDRKLACELKDEMDRRKVDDDDVDVKQMVLQELERMGPPAIGYPYHHQIPEPIHPRYHHPSYHPPPRMMMLPAGMIPSRPSRYTFY